MKLDRRLGFLYRRFLVCNYFPPTSQPRKDERLHDHIAGINCTAGLQNKLAERHSKRSHSTILSKDAGSAGIYGIQKEKGTGTRDIISLYILADVTEGSL